ncbi:MAG: hypothetical protein PHN82_04880 [bacterium]|nr:hypothetical protein [bacterium]
MRARVTGGAASFGARLRAGWRRHRLISVCMLVSLIAHFIVLFSTPPWWRRRPPPPPRPTRSIALRIAPRPVPPRPAPPAAPAPPVAPRPLPPRRRGYTPAEMERRLEPVRSREITERVARPPAERVREVMREKESAAREWAKIEFETVRQRIRRIEEGAVGFRRVVDLRKTPEHQIARLMEQFDMEFGFGAREVTDMNIRFTAEWILTPPQVRNVLARRPSASRRAIVEAIPRRAAEVAFQESADGPPRSFIRPTIRAVAAILAAEEAYFSETGDDPERMERLVFAPVWTFRGPGFRVVEAERRKADGTPVPPPE